MVIVSPPPLEGSQPSVTENTSISIRPIQNGGRLMPKMEPVIIVLDQSDFGLSPAITPSGSPMSEIANADIQLSSVAGSRFANSSLTGIHVWNALPRSKHTL